MLYKNIILKEFGINKKKLEHKNKIVKLIKKYSTHKLIKSFSKEYKYTFDKSKINKYKKFSSYSIIGLGGSSLGIEAIYNFLNHKIKKKLILLII